MKEKQEGLEKSYNHYWIKQRALVLRLQYLTDLNFINLQFLISSNNSQYSKQILTIIILLIKKGVTTTTITLQQKLIQEIVKDFCLLEEY